MDEFGISEWIGVGIGAFLWIAYCLGGRGESGWFWQIKVAPGVRYFATKPTWPVEDAHAPAQPPDEARIQPKP